MKIGLGLGLKTKAPSGPVPVPPTVGDADAQNLVNRMFALDTIDQTRADLINSFFVSIKADGLFTKIDALYFTAAHVQSAARLNWIKNAHNITEANSPTFTIDRGYTGNGSDMYLNTNYIPISDGVAYLQDDCSAGFYIRNSPSTSGYRMGSWSLLVIRYFSATSVQYGISSTPNPNPTVPDGKGMTCINRTASNNQNVYINGALDSSNSNASSGVANSDVYLLAANDRDSPFGFSDDQIAFSYMGGSLDGTEQGNLFTHVETFLDAIGAGVIV